jgi:hypothetical protein
MGTIFAAVGGITLLAVVGGLVRTDPYRHTFWRLT